MPSSMTTRERASRRAESGGIDLSSAVTVVDAQATVSKTVRTICLRRSGRRTPVWNMLLLTTSAISFGRLVQGHGGANESLQRLLLYLLALVEVDCAPRVPLEAGVEESRGVLQGRPLGEGHLHDALVGLARADDSVVRPHRNASPLPFLDHFGIGFLDQGTEAAEHFAPPVAKLLDSRVDQPRRRRVFRRPALLHARFSLTAISAAAACVRARLAQSEP